MKLLLAILKLIVSWFQRKQKKQEEQDIVEQEKDHQQFADDVVSGKEDEVGKKLNDILNR